MYASASNNPCLIHAGPEGFEFSIPGGATGWEQAGEPPTVTTRILVAADGRALLQSEQSGAVAFELQAQCRYDHRQHPAAPCLANA